MPDRTEKGRSRRSRGSARRQVDPEALRAISGRITALQEQRDPDRRSVFVDGEFALGLHVETIVRCGLKVGQEVDGETLAAAYGIELERQVREAGLRLLAAAPRTRLDVARRLGRRYPQDVVERVVERLEEAGWLDDRSYAEGYVRSHPDYGSRRLLAELIRKGVDREIAAAVVEAARGSGEAVEHARSVAAERLRRMSGVDRATAARRLAGFLARRGFGPETVRAAVEPLVAELPDAQPGRHTVRPDRNSTQPGSRGAQPRLRRGGLQRRSALGRSRWQRRDDDWPGGENGDE